MWIAPRSYLPFVVGALALCAAFGAGAGFMGAGPKGSFPGEEAGAVAPVTAADAAPVGAPGFTANDTDPGDPAAKAADEDAAKAAEDEKKDAATAEADKTAPAEPETAAPAPPALPRPAALAAPKPPAEAAPPADDKVGDLLTAPAAPPADESIPH